MKVCRLLKFKVNEKNEVNRAERERTRKKLSRMTKDKRGPTWIIHGAQTGL
jgi:hypothetical protein